MIRVKNLNLECKGRKFLQDISFELHPKSALGVLGKSGAGKSLLAKSLLCLINKPFMLSADELSVAGFSPLNLDKNALRTLRTKVGFIFQDARASFHPMFNMGDIFENLFGGGFGKGSGATFHSSFGGSGRAQGGSWTSGSSSAQGRSTASGPSAAQTGDRTTTVRVPFITACLGGEAPVNTGSGRIMVKIPAGMQSGAKIRIRGKGMPSGANPSVKGDLYVVVEVIVPKNLSPEAVDKLKEFEGACYRSKAGGAA